MAKKTTTPIVPNELTYAGNQLNPTITPDAPPVEDTPQVRCTDGSYAASLEECPQLTTDEYNPDIGWSPDPEGDQGDFISGFGEDEDSALADIYDAIGGESWTNLNFEEWKELYKDDFPTWDKSVYKRQTENIEAGMALLGEQLKLTKESAELSAESLRFTTGAALEDAGANREAAVRAAGGLQTGAIEKKFDNAYDRILRGFDFDAEGQEIALSQSLIDVEGRRLDYGMDLLNVVENYQDSMWDLIVANKTLQKGPDNNVNTGFAYTGDYNLSDPIYEVREDYDRGSGQNLIKDTIERRTEDNKLINENTGEPHTLESCRELIESTGGTWEVGMFTRAGGCKT